MLGKYQDVPEFAWLDDEPDAVNYLLHTCL